MATITNFVSLKQIFPHNKLFYIDIMKKLLFVYALIILLAGNSNAQVIFSQDFQSTGNSIPAGWKQQNSAYIPTNLGWQFGNYAGGYFGYYDVPYHGNMAFINDDDNNYPTTMWNYDTLYTPIISLSSYSKVFISFDVWYYQYATGTATLAASTDSGKTWSTLDTNGGASGFNWRTATYDISSLGGQANVMLAFTYQDGGYDLLGECINYVKVYVPNDYDMAVTNQNLPFLFQTGNSYTVSGVIRNSGYQNISSMRLNYCVNGGPTISAPLSSLNIPALTNYSFTHPIQWVPSVTGNNVMKIWADSLNGNNADQDHPNDTLTAVFEVIDSIQVKAPMIEEFTQASCSPCLYYSPQLDSILDSVKTFCNPIRYHVNWPARDFMNNVTQPVVAPRVSFYTVPGVPMVYMDGKEYFDFTYSGLTKEAAIGSQFKIMLNATYNPLTNVYHVITNIKSYAQLPAGLKAYVVLTVDTMKYAQDQSLAEPQWYFEPPIGTTIGGSPDDLYPYALNYPQVVENIMPDGYGTKLGSFIPGQTQTLNLSWTKNRAWADSNKLWVYDSVGTHVTVFIQDTVSHYVYQSAVAVPVVITGMEEISSATNFELFPNPASQQTTVAFNLKQEQEITIELYNLMGEKVYSSPIRNVSAGNHFETILTKNLSAGIYFVRFRTANGTSVKKLVVE